MTAFNYLLRAHLCCDKSAFHYYQFVYVNLLPFLSQGSNTSAITDCIFM